jgi:hypothetical protein
MLLRSLTFFSLHVFSSFCQVTVQIFVSLSYFFVFNHWLMDSPTPIDLFSPCVVGKVFLRVIRNVTFLWVEKRRNWRSGPNFMALRDRTV